MTDDEIVHATDGPMTESDEAQYRSESAEAPPRVVSEKSSPAQIGYEINLVQGSGKVRNSTDINNANSSAAVEVHLPELDAPLEVEREDI